MAARFDDSVSLDERLDCFEDAWRHALTSPCVRDFLPPPQAPLRARALIELVMIDLERRLRRERQSQAEDREGHWLIGSYLRDYPELLEGKGLLGELVCFDARLRNAIGSPLNLDGYYSQLSVLAHMFEQDLRQAFSEMAAATLLWFNGGRLIWRDPLPPILELGRAMEGEAPVPCQFATPRGARLIIAEAGDVNISRRQLLVEVVGPHRIRITNTSKNVECGLGTDRRLLPGCRVNCDSSVSMRVDSAVLRIDFPPQEK